MAELAGIGKELLEKLNEIEDELGLPKSHNAEDKRMTREEIIANEKYHTCGKCKWEDYPFICHQCKWGEDVRKDLWQLKEEDEE